MVKRLAFLVLVSTSLMGAYAYTRQFASSRVAVSFTSGASATAWLPLHVLPSGLIVVESIVRISGLPVNMIALISR